MPLRKTYTEMLHKPRQVEVSITDKAMMGIPAGAKMLISTPLEIRDFIAAIPSGKSVPVAEMRDSLAKKYQADVACPLTTGIFLRIVADAALEDLAKGAKPEEITPFWRVITPKDKVAVKLACGPEWIEARRKMEGIE